LYEWLAAQSRADEAEAKLQYKRCRRYVCEITLFHLFCDQYCAADSQLLS